MRSCGTCRHYSRDDVLDIRVGGIGLGYCLRFPPATVEGTPSKHSVRPPRPRQAVFPIVNQIMSCGEHAPADRPVNLEPG